MTELEVAKLRERIVNLADGNPGALGTILDAINLGGGVDIPAYQVVDRLEDSGWRGSLIYIAFNDWARRDVLKFLRAIVENDEDLARFMRENREVALRRDSEC